MKFKNIPQVKKAYYKVNISWSYLESWLDGHLDMKANLNPDYHRNYVWTKKQKEQYLEWILKGGESGKNIYWNCPGWMTHNQKNQLELVDGQQRVKAVLEFLHNKVKAFGKTMDELGGRNSLHLDYEFIFHVARLETRKEILQWYLDMNTGGTIHTDDEINKVKKLIKKEK